MLKNSQDIDKLIQGIDLSVTMYKKAEEKYKAVSKVFGDNDIECEIYPQGSFALGTTIRPLKEGKMGDYDLDFICLLKNKSNKTAREVRGEALKILKSNKIYKDKIKECDKCITIEFAEINGIGFNLDILPAADIEKEENNDPNFVKVTNKKEERVEWFIINPKTYTEWFNEINDCYPGHRSVRIFCESVDNSIEDLPDYFERTSLQRVIQILKHHRNYYYCKIKKENHKIISAIITTLCTQIARDLKYTAMDTNTLLENIVRELKLYSEYMSMEESSFSLKYINKNIIKKKGKVWIIKNPVNEDDNLADQWNDETAKTFFTWIESLEKEFLSDSLKMKLYSYRNIFGESYSESILKNSEQFKQILLEDSKAKELKPITPWRDK